MPTSAAVATSAIYSNFREAVGCRLSADSELSTLPQVILKKIMQLALQPCTLQLYHVDSGTLIELSDGKYH